MRTLLMICALLLIAGTALAVPVEWPISAGGNGHYYEIVIAQGDKSWLNGHYVSLGRNHGGMQGHLATLTTRVEYDWVIQTMVSPIASPAVFFLGGWNDGFIGNGGFAQLRAWHWITDEAWGFEPWAKGEPSETPHIPPLTLEFALSYLHKWGFPTTGFIGFNNLIFDYNQTAETVGFVVEYDGLPLTNLPPLDHPVAVEVNTWGSLKALYR